ncbi:hypothetical protein [Iodidimonas nitroreducens]|uniref:hypothetical protein n=1 Tax=Iodidimonas nitroreducens TaxID=1236968 RepID=UPI00123037AB|nr:hypothetical protein [Iodidimonas nitroreducens]
MAAIHLRDNEIRHRLNPCASADIAKNKRPGAPHLFAIAIHHLKGGPTNGARSIFTPKKAGDHKTRVDGLFGDRAAHPQIIMIAAFTSIKGSLCSAQEADASPRVTKHQRPALHAMVRAGLAVREKNAV